MRRSAPLCLALLLALAAPAAADPVFPPGASIGLTPPAEMQPGRGFQGFEDQRTGASIAVFEMPAEAFERIAASVELKALADQGVTDAKREALAIQGASEAFLVTGDQSAEGSTLRKWLLVARTPDLTALVVAEALTEREPFDPQALREAVLSVAFRDPPPIEEQISALPFRLRERAEFRPLRTMGGNSLMLTKGDKDEIEKAEQPVLMVAAAVTGPVPEPAREPLAQQALAGLAGLKGLKVERSEGFRLHNADWHEIVATGQEAGGEAVAVIQSIRFTPDGFIRAVGISRAAQREAVMPQFRRVIDAVEPR